MDTFVKTMYYLFIALLTIYPILELFKKTHKKSYKAVVIVVVILFLVFAFWNKNIEDREKNAASDLANAQHALDSNNIAELKRSLDSLKKLNPADIYIQGVNAKNFQFNGNVIAKEGMTPAMKDSMNREQEKMRKSPN